MTPVKKLALIGTTAVATALLIFIPLRAADVKNPQPSDSPPPQIQTSTAITTADTAELLGFLRFWMLARDLELSKEQAIRFAPLFEELQRLKDRFRESRRQVHRRLQEVDTTEVPDEEKLAALQEWQRVEDEFWREVQRVKAELNQQLTPDQRVKFALFNEAYQRKMQKLMASLRQIAEAK